MSKNFYVKLSGKKIAVEGALASQEKSKVNLVSRPGGAWVLRLPDGTQTKAFYFEKGGRFSGNIHGRLIAGEWIAAPSEGPRDEARGGDSDLTARFPGKVRKVLAQAGTKVEEGESLLLVEAMKMEFAVKAPYSGVVKAILVKEGQTLAPGDRLVDLVEWRGGE